MSCLILYLISTNNSIQMDITSSQAKLLSPLPWMKWCWTCHHPPPLLNAIVARTVVLNAIFCWKWQGLMVKCIAIYLLYLCVNNKLEYLHDMERFYEIKTKPQGQLVPISFSNINMGRLQKWKELNIWKENM